MGILVASIVALSIVSPQANVANPAVKVVKVYYDSPGKDTRSNASLNAEYVWLKNTTSKTIKLGGWSMSDRSGHRYLFKAGTAIKAGKTYTLRTGQGSDVVNTVYWGSGNYVWNNGSDSAILKNPSGKVVSVCSYSNSSVDYKVC